MKIKGVRTDCNTDEEIEVELEFETVSGDPDDSFQLIGGPTGYESFYMHDFAVKGMREKGWCACSGTKPVGTAYGWDRLMISAEQMCLAFDSIEEMAQ